MEKVSKKVVVFNGSGSKSGFEVVQAEHSHQDDGEPNVQQTPLIKRRKRPSFLLLGSLLLICMSFAQLMSNSGKTPRSSRASIKLSSSDVYGESFRLPNGRYSRPNPDVSLKDKLFCRGRHVAQGCKNTVYHPYMRWWKTYRDDDGVTYSGKQTMLGAITGMFSKGRERPSHVVKIKAEKQHYLKKAS